MTPLDYFRRNTTKESSMYMPSTTSGYGSEGDHLPVGSGEIKTPNEGDSEIDPDSIFLINEEDPHQMEKTYQMWHLFVEHDCASVRNIYIHYGYLMTCACIPGEGSKLNYTHQYIKKKYSYPMGLIRIFLVICVTGLGMFMNSCWKKKFSEEDYDVATLREEISNIEDQGYAVLDDNRDNYYSVLDDNSDNHSAVHDMEDDDSACYANLETSSVVYLLDLGLLAARLGLYVGRTLPPLQHQDSHRSIYDSLDSVVRAQVEAYAMWGVSMGGARPRPHHLSHSCHRRSHRSSIDYNTVSEYFRRRETPSPIPDDDLMHSHPILAHQPGIISRPLTFPLRNAMSLPRGIDIIHTYPAQNEATIITSR
nr:uncharacterized protein LOC123772236 [Procambarus clarkii]